MASQVDTQLHADCLDTRSRATHGQDQDQDQRDWGRGRGFAG